MNTVEHTLRVDSMTREDGMSVSKEAMHEAGHAVVACVLGFTVTRIDIIPREVPNAGGELGRAGVEIDMPTVSSIAGKGESSVREVLAVLYAGIASERIVDPDSRIEENCDVSDGDRALEYAATAIFPLVLKNGHYVMEVNPDRLKSFLSQSEDFATDLVKKHQKAIVALATLLQVEKELNGDEIEDCIASFLSQDDCHDL
jgi:ATP-dependent Zn protease